MNHHLVGLVLFPWIALSVPAVASIALVSGDLVASEQSPPTLHGVDRVSGASTGSCPCSACTSSIKDVTVHGTSEIYVSTRYEIVEIDASSCANRVVTSIQVASGFFTGITLDRDGALLVTAADCTDCVREPSRTYGGVLRVDRSSGTQSILFSGPPMISPDGLAVAPDGRIYVAAQDTAAGFDSGVIRIDPASPATAAFVAIGDDTAAPIDRTDIVSATDVAIENSAGPLYVLDTRYRGSTLQDELRIIAVDLAGAPTSNQTLLTEGLEGVNQDRSSGSLLGIDILGGTLLTFDHVFSTGSSSDYAGVVSFVPGVSSGEGTHLTDASAFYYPSGLALVPEPEPLGAGVTACLALMSLLARAATSSSKPAFSPLTSTRRPGVGPSKPGAARSRPASASWPQAARR
jgi:hypothetical protein